MGVDELFLAEGCCWYQSLLGREAIPGNWDDRGYILIDLFFSEEQIDMIF